MIFVLGIVAIGQVTSPARLAVAQAVLLPEDHQGASVLPADAAPAAHMTVLARPEYGRTLSR